MVRFLTHFYMHCRKWLIVPITDATVGCNSEGRDEGKRQTVKLGVYEKNYWIEPVFRDIDN